jgi:hypothetical protein
MPESVPTQTFYNRDLGLGTTAASLPPKLVSILQKVEDHTFRASARQYDTFKAFDHDHDGYVSQQDFVNHITQMEILTNPEM